MRFRKNNRLKKHDYTKPGNYFVTIRVQDMHCVLGHIAENDMVLNKFGLIVVDQLSWLNDHYDFVELNEFVVMPNHVHAIVRISPRGSEQSPLSLSQLIGAFKTLSCTRLRKYGLNDFSWHRSFYDRIIRHQTEYDITADYIRNNPKRWSSKYNRSATSRSRSGRA